MEKKNTVLLTVIAVATLLVAVVGATFAYFTATSSSAAGAAGDTVNVKTAEVGDSAEINTVSTKSGTTAFYPGTIGYVESEVSVKKTSANSSNTLDIGYSISGSVTIDGLTDGKWTLYKSTEKISDVVTGCKTGDYSETDGTGTKYKDSCTLNPKLSAVTSGTTSGVTYVNGGTSSSSTISDTGTLTTAATTAAGGKVYYYLVVEFENKDEDQNTQQGVTVNFSLNAATATSTTVSGS